MAPSLILIGCNGMSESTSSTGMDRANAEFWDELCGTVMARQLGIKDHSPESLRRFDEAYLAFYPYLLEHVDLPSLTGRRVVEVGLGYGTVGERLARAGAHYTGIDLAPGPVAMMRRRLGSLGAANAVRASMLSCPLRSESVDVVVSIGCFHHTGDVQRCLDETWRILRPGGSAVLMVYNQFSYRQWGRWPASTMRALLHDYGLLRRPNAVTERQRAAYDADTTGRGAAETTFFSIRRLSRMLARFSRVSFAKENCGGGVGVSVPLPLQLRAYAGIEVPRERLLATLGRWWGLDVYVRAVK